MTKYFLFSIFISQFCYISIPDIKDPKTSILHDRETNGHSLPGQIREFSTDINIQEECWCLKIPINHHTCTLKRCGLDLDHFLVSEILKKYCR